jgi:hypothetical protein
LKPKKVRTISMILLALVAIFVTLVFEIFSGAKRIPFPALAAFAAVFGFLGVFLTVQTARKIETRMFKTFLILTGVGATGIPVSILLHNIVYGIFIKLFGEGFWGPDGDEPVFFILALFVFPALFLFGVIGSGILLIKNYLTKKEV